ESRNKFLLPVKAKTKQIQRSSSMRKVSKERKNALNSLDESLIQNFQNAIIFLGFDTRYAGNSRFLFDSLLEDSRFSNQPIFFVTDDEKVPQDLRIDPSSEWLVKSAVLNASIVLAESWTPTELVKNRTSTWI